MQTFQYGRVNGELHQRQADLTFFLTQLIYYKQQRKKQLGILSGRLITFVASKNA